MVTGWTEEYLLSRPHHHNRRKFSTYRLLDRLRDSRPITVLPAVGKNLAMQDSGAVMETYLEQYGDFKELLGIEEAELGPDPKDAEFMMQWFERRYGRKPVAIEDLING